MQVDRGDKEVYYCNHSGILESGSKGFAERQNYIQNKSQTKHAVVLPVFDGSDGSDPIVKPSIVS
jgi:hypothetical protein